MNDFEPTMKVQDRSNSFTKNKTSRDVQGRLKKKYYSYGSSDCSYYFLLFFLSFYFFLLIFNYSVFSLFCYFVLKVKIIESNKSLLLLSIKGLT
jgi:hypothetical protein